MSERFYIIVDGKQRGGFRKDEAAATVEGQRLRKAGHRVEVWCEDGEGQFLVWPVLVRQEDSREANRIDGYDRDDLGESPDY